MLIGICHKRRASESHEGKQKQNGYDPHLSAVGIQTGGELAVKEDVEMMQSPSALFIMLQYPLGKLPVKKHKAYSL